MPDTTYEIKDGKMRPVADRNDKDKKDAQKPSAAKSGYETKQEAY